MTDEQEIRGEQEGNDAPSLTSQGRVAQPHTPGPWRVKGDGVKGLGGILVASLSATTPPSGSAERAANASLIATAPDLLALLKEARATLAVDGTAVGLVREPPRVRRFMNGIHGLHRRIDAAIARAEGH